MSDTSAHTGAAVASSAGELIDIAGRAEHPQTQFRIARVAWGLLIGVFLVAPTVSLLVTAFVMVQTPLKFLVLGVGVVVAVVVCVSIARETQRRIESRVAEEIGKPTAEVFRAILDRGPDRSTRESLYAAGKCLARTGRVNQTIRIAPAEALESITPFNEPFEPCPLEANDSAFRALVHADQRTSPDGAAPSSIATPAEPSLWSRFLNTRGFGVFILVAPLALMLSTGKLDRVSVCLMGASLMFFLWALLTPSGVRLQWFAVPGGLILREAKTYERQWRVRVIDRRCSVLCACWISRSVWDIGVFTGDGAWRLHHSTEELRMLLRAWLSLLNPPPVERLTDLV